MTLLMLMSFIFCAKSGLAENIKTPVLPMSVHAATCIVNTTHCHCAHSTAKAGQMCVTPVFGSTTRCTKVQCSGGYKCDCAADTICEILSSVSYKAGTNVDDSKDEFDCVRGSKEVPKIVVGQTTDFHMMAYQMFSLFVNYDMKGFAMTNAYKVMTAELKSGDVIGVIARRMNDDKYGMKLRFKDLRGEIRVIDENWYCSSAFLSEWLASSFEPVAKGWMRPALTSAVSENGFDKDVPWMWLSTNETVYCRYVVQ